MILVQALHFLILFVALQLTDTLFRHFDMALEKEDTIKKQMFKQTIMQKWAFKNGRSTRVQDSVSNDTVRSASKHLKGT